MTYYCTSKIFLISLKLPFILGDNNIPIINLGILILKETANRYKLKVEVLDGDFQVLADDKIVELLLAERPKVVGFSPCQLTMERTIRMIKRISIDSPNTIIILGGYQASMMAYIIMQDIPEVDFIIKGEAEQAFPDLLLTILDQNKKKLSEINGLVYRINGVIVENKTTAYKELEDLPNIGISQVRVTNEIALITSRGCVSKCAFCCTPSFMKISENNSIRSQSSKKVIQDIEEIIINNNKKKLNIHFYDADFVGLSKKSIERAEEIADHILLKNITIQFRFTVQAKAIKKAGKNFWKKWKLAGLSSIYCGFESGVTEELEYYNKSSNIEDAYEAFSILKECDIYFHIGFIMFNPYSNKERLSINLSFLEQIDKLHIYKNISTELIPYPSTRVYSDLENKNLLEFDKPYLITKIKYKSQFINSLKTELLKYKEIQFEIDRFCYNFDFAISNKMSTIEIDHTVLDLDSELCDKYFNYKKLRSATIQLFFNDMLSCSLSEFSDLGTAMNKTLLNIHQQFLIIFVKQ